MHKINYHNLSSDLLALYAKTNNKEIESLYLRCAKKATKEEYSLRDFISERGNETGASSTTLNTLKSLYSIMDYLAGANDIYKFTSYLSKNKSDEDKVPVIKLMGQIYSSGQHQDVLAPFSNIFNLTRLANVIDPKTGHVIPTPNAQIPIETIESDLTKIHMAYEKVIGDPTQIYDDYEDLIVKKKESKTERSINLLRYSLVAFSNELTNIAKQQGREDLVKIFTPEFLVDPRKLYETFSVDVPNITLFVNDIRNMMKNIMSGIMIRSVTESYDIIRTKALFMGGQITEAEARKHFADKASDVRGILGGDHGHGDEESMIMNVDRNKLMNMSVIMYFSMAMHALSSRARKINQ